MNQIGTLTDLSSAWRFRRRNLKARTPAQRLPGSQAPRLRGLPSRLYFINNSIVSPLNNDLFVDAIR